MPDPTPILKEVPAMVEGDYRFSSWISYGCALFF